MKKSLLLLLFASALAFQAPAAAKVLHLKCSHNYRGQVLESYVFVDLDRKAARFSDRPIDDASGSAAQVTEASVTWRESFRSSDNTYVLDRHSGRMKVHVRNKQGTNSAAYNCNPM